MRLTLYVGMKTKYTTAKLNLPDLLLEWATAIVTRGCRFCALQRFPMKWYVYSDRKTEKQTISWGTFGAQIIGNLGWQWRSPIETSWILLWGWTRWGTDSLRPSEGRFWSRPQIGWVGDTPVPSPRHHRFANRGAVVEAVRREFKEKYNRTLCARVRN